MMRKDILKGKKRKFLIYLQTTSQIFRPFDENFSNKPLHNNVVVTIREVVSELARYQSNVVDLFLLDNTFLLFVVLIIFQQNVFSRTLKDKTAEDTPT